MAAKVTPHLLDLPSRKLTRKPIKGPIKTTVPINQVYMGFHVSLGEGTLFEVAPLAWPFMLQVLIDHALFL